MPELLSLVSATLFVLGLIVLVFIQSRFNTLNVSKTKLKVYEEIVDLIWRKRTAISDTSELETIPDLESRSVVVAYDSVIALLTQLAADEIERMK